MLLLLAALVPLAAAYPLGLGRYGRSLGGWPPLGLYYPPRTTRPYYYMPQDPYYYPVVPSYYQRPYYYGYDEVTEPTEDQEEVTEEESGRRLAGAYGQEAYYVGDPYQETNDDVNARFLQNLILAQMYSDANKLYGGVGGQYEESSERDEGSGSVGGSGSGNGNGERWVYGEPVKSSRPAAKASKEDEDVRELKSLVSGDRKKERRQRPERREREWKNRKGEGEGSPFDAQRKSNDWDEFRSSSYKRSDAEAAPRGQKEVAPAVTTSARAGRPAVAVAERRAPRQPSVYDTIKKLLHMEERLEEEKTPASRLQKRSYIASEDSLVAELGGLKKAA